MRCYEVDITFHYQIDGGLTNSTITNTKVQFSSLFQQVPSLLSLHPGCSGVVITRKDILSSLPGVKSIFFTIPMIFTASTNVVDGQISTKIAACINTLTTSYKGLIDSYTPSIFQNGTHNTHNASTISKKRSCCGGNIPPPCCTVGSFNVSSSKCGKLKQRMDYICSWPRIRDEQNHLLCSWAKLHQGGEGGGFEIENMASRGASVYKGGDYRVLTAG